MKLFDIEPGGRVVLNPTSLWIPEFRYLWERDKSKDKSQAAKEISYIVFMYDYKSPYQAYSETERERHIIKDYFKEQPEWKPDEAVKAATTRFVEFQDTAALRLLRSTKLALDTINEYFKTAGPDEIDKIVKNAKELGNLVQSLDKLEQQVQKEQLDKTVVRGNREVGLFEL